MLGFVAVGLVLLNHRPVGRPVFINVDKLPRVQVRNSVHAVAHLPESKKLGRSAVPGVQLRPRKIVAGTRGDIHNKPRTYAARYAHGSAR